MKMASSSTVPPFAAVRCSVEPSDIDAMDYWLNESPMSTPAEHNAIVFALKRVLREDLTVRLEAATGAGPLHAVIGEESVALPEGWSDWWKRAREGGRMSPMTAILWLPRHLLPLQSPPKDTDSLTRRVRWRLSPRRRLPDAA